jgi:hypothetical protein
MKSVLLTLLAVGSINALAQTNAVTLPAKDLALVSTKNNTMEGGMEVSSLNNGTVSAAISYIHEYDMGFALGIRGEMPLEFNNQSNTYQIQGLGRFLFVNDVNRLFAEGNLTQAFFNDVAGTTPFFMIGGNVGYSRMITRQISVGGRLGLDLATARLSHNDIDRSSTTIYNKLAVEGAYFF